MTFMHMVEFVRADLVRMRALNDEWEQATEGMRTARRQMLASDRYHPGHYLEVVFFDSNESAMENSGLPETQVSATKMAALTEGEPSFRDLDVIEDRS